MHTILACLSVVLAALSWAWSVRRIRSVERRLAAAERHREDDAAIGHGRMAAMAHRLDRLEQRAVCRRPHAEDFAKLAAPRAWRDDEEQFNLVR